MFGISSVYSKSQLPRVIFEFYPIFIENYIFHSYTYIKSMLILSTFQELYRQER
jgi:hypothetical protein